MIENSHGKIEVNISAPKFKLKDVFDRDVDLEAYRGSKILIGFYRHAGCPFCNLRVHKLMKNYLDGSFKNLKLIFFFESKKQTLALSSFLKTISPVPIISDPEKIWYQTYGIEESKSKSAIGHLTTFIQTAIEARLKNLPTHMMVDGESFGTMPGEFLVDENLIIRKIYHSQRLSDRMDVGEIVEFANK